MKRKYMYIALTMILACIAIAFAVNNHYNKDNSLPTSTRLRQKVRQALSKATPRKQAAPQKPATEIKKDSLANFITGRLTDTEGNPVGDVTVSNGISCTVTDSTGRYKLPADKGARFVFYTVPNFCEVPTHSETDHTAMFYLPVSAKRKTYDFKLTRLTDGKENSYRMIVIGDPQVTNAFNPYYTAANDNRIEMSDVERFATETMTDIRHTISQLPAGTPVYGISMGDDVQYYGGYNPMLQKQIREVMGASKMRIFSVIGNHDQDGKDEYTRKWEENWGPTDYSFDRGNEHYVCLNNVHFLGKNHSYFSPGELTDRQMEWLRQDLKLTPKSKKVVICYHIPLTFGNNPYSKATPLGIKGEEGHFASARLHTLLGMLAQFSGGYELFCGHTHFAINHEISFEGQHILEHCHAAACGTIWQSNINICGTPNGYYVYSFKEGDITNCYYKGTFWNARKQMTLFSADEDFNGESYAADWNLEHGKGIIVANVFNADSRWKVVAEENGVSHPMHRIDSRGQDAFATGYHHKYSEASGYRFVSKENSYLLMNHIYYYQPTDPQAEIHITATDPYGNTYTESSRNIVKEPFFNFAHYYGSK